MAGGAVRGASACGGQVQSRIRFAVFLAGVLNVFLLYGAGLVGDLTGPLLVLLLLCVLLWDQAREDRALGVSALADDDRGDDDRPDRRGRRKR